MCLRNKDIIMEFVEEIASCEDEKNSDDLIVFKRSRIKDEDDDKGSDRIRLKPQRYNRISFFRNQTRRNIRRGDRYR